MQNKAQLIPYTQLQAGDFYLLQALDSDKVLSELNRYTNWKSTTATDYFPANANLLFWMNTPDDLKYLPSKPVQGSLVVVLTNKRYWTALSPYLSRLDAAFISNRTEVSTDILSQILFGGREAKGVLAEELDSNFQKGFGIQTSITRLAYGTPEEVGWNTNWVKQQVDSLMQLAIEKQAFPGAQLLVAKKGIVVLHETYGYHTYDQKTPVQKNDVYDLASVTKITTALPAIMQLYDQRKIDLDQPFSKYWKPWKKHKEKKELTLRQILAHQAGLKPYIVFLAKAMRKGKLKKRFINTIRDPKYPIQAHDSLYVHPRFHRKMQRIINRSVVNKQKKYRYSGLSFLVYPKLVKQLTGIEFS
ncbi:MAG: beta-lactamase family protein, partial [Flavobacteriaceae bacterium]|nr:beta-lactamase family protein [Flavobacteriaceae bacterium]